jgi:hypothetical protein
MPKYTSALNAINAEMVDRSILHWKDIII